jgi:hypothetical protein
MARSKPARPVHAWGSNRDAICALKDARPSAVNVTLIRTPLEHNPGSWEGARALPISRAGVKRKIDRGMSICKYSIKHKRERILSESTGRLGAPPVHPNRPSLPADPWLFGGL